MNILIKMKRAKSIAFVFTFFLFSLITGNFLSLNVTSAGKTTATVTYDYYVVAGYDMTPTPPSTAPAPLGFTFNCSPPVFNFGNITYWGGRTYLYEGWFGSNVHAFTMLNITNLLGHDITVLNLTVEVTDGTPTKDFLFSPAGMWFGNYTLVIVDTLDPWNPVSPVDECNYYTGDVTVVNDGVDWWTKAVGTPYPEGWQTGPASLLEPDNDGDAEATNHTAPLQLANGSTLTEYFGVTIFGDADLGTQIDGTITLSLTYEYTVPGSPVASFTYSPTEPTIGEAVTFDASTSTPDGGNLTDPESYVWDLGDETNGTGMIVNHAYTKPGTYTVALNVTDSDGKWDIAFKSVKVRPVPRTIWVPDNFTSIQEAINNASDGDTVFVRADVYYENPVVNKSVWLIGENKETTIIDGNMSGTVVSVRASDVLVTNFTIRNGSGTMVSGGGAHIVDNVITNHTFGIEILFSANNVISGNTIINNGYGLYFFGSNNTISGNYVSNNTWGIVGSMSNSTVSGNVMNGNEYSLFVLGDPPLSIDVSNLVDGKPVYYFVHQKDLVINSSTYPEVGYLALVNCSNMVVEGLTLTDNGQGLLLAYTNNSRITGNNITDNAIGIQIQSSCGNNISGNTLTHNMLGGVSVDGSNNTLFKNNLGDNEGSGVVLGGQNNTVTENVFVNCGLLAGPDLFGYGSPMPYGNRVENNTVNGEPLVYLEGVSDRTVLGGVGQVVLVNCSRIRVENLTLSNATVGVWLWRTNNTMISRNIIANNTGAWSYGGVTLLYSSNNTITGNTITNCSAGVYLMGSPYNIISGNQLTNNSVGLWVYSESANTTVSGNNLTDNGSAVWLWSEGVLVERNNIEDNDNGVNLFVFGRNNIVRKNNVSRNGKGIVLSGMVASDNQIYHNNFVDNEIQVELPPDYPFPVKNTWDNGYPCGGNYWSDYNGTDSDNDGIGNASYIINKNNQDRYPLMGPINFFDAGTWNETTYYVHTVSNSTISNFYFNPDEGPLISFNVTGPDGTLGFSRITIPKELLWCDSPEEWQVWVNNTIIEDRKIIEDKNCTYIYFTYNHTTQNVEVKGAHVIPEFSPGTSMLLILITLTVAIAFYKRRLIKTPNH